MRITLLVGLPGSGKSHYAQTLGADLIIDDPRSFEEITGHNKDHMVIIDPYFCRPSVLMKAYETLSGLYPQAELDTIFFRNDVAQCLENAKLRPDKKVDNLIVTLSKVYFPPNSAMKVWRPICE